MDQEEFTKLGDIWVPRIFYALAAILFTAIGLKTVLEGGEAGNAVVYGILALPVAAIYFYPSIIAYKRENRYKMPIFIFNIIFGWTVIGWGIALVWAYWPDKDENAGKVIQPITSPRPPAGEGESTVTVATEPQTQSPTEKRLAALEHLAKLHASGVVTDEEFQAEKKKIIDSSE